MKKIFAITSLALLLPFVSYAKPDPQLLNKLDNRRAELENRIATEPDPKKRKQYIHMLYQTQEYYLTDKSRMEMVRETHPEFVKQVEYYRALPPEVKEKRLNESIKNQMSKSTEIIMDPNTKWEQSSKEQRFLVCTGAVNRCIKEEKMNECKFVLLRCKKIIDEKSYNQVKEFVRKKAEDK